MALSMVQKVGSFAFYSRLLVWCMQIFFNYLIPDHDPRAFSPPSVHQKSGGDEWAALLLEGFKRWDGMYFLHVAEHGYSYENTLAFFPLFPLFVHVMANTVLYPLQYILNYSSVLLASAAIINLICFIQAAKILYLLSLRVLGDQTLAFRASQLFCINPASIFFSAAYSETLFALISFSGMLQLECGAAGWAAVLFGISGLCRSNGLVNSGFVLYKAFREFADHVTNLSKLSAKENICIRILQTFGRTCVSTAFCLALCLLPFLGYQYFAYHKFCNLNADSKDLQPHILSYGNEKRYKMAHAGFSPWCFHSPPLSYAYIQETHWDVGFLKYYEWKQAPNFLLAAPMVLICLAAMGHYLRRNFALFVSLGLHNPTVDTYKKTEEMADASQQRDHGFYNPRCYVYLVHMIFLVTVGCLFMHVQVVTRFIASACPVIYWFIAHITTPEDQFKPLASRGVPDYSASASSGSGGLPPSPSSAAGRDAFSSTSEAAADELLDWDSSGIFKRAILVYFHFYMFVGTAAFSNSLPWT